MPTRRALRSVAHNFVDSVLSGPYSTPQGDLLPLMTTQLRQSQAEELSVDLLQGRLSPSTLETPPLLAAASAARDRLGEIAESVGFSRGTITSADWRMTRAPTALEATRWPSTLVLVDDRQGQHELTLPPS
jgi:hypothetical protein